MIEESKYCTDVMKKNFNEELVMIKEENEDFENFTKCWICEESYVDGNVKVRDHRHTKRNYRGSAHRDYKISTLH